MKKSRILAVVFGVLVVVLAGSLMVVAGAPIAPHVQTVEKPIPDDRISH